MTEQPQTPSAESANATSAELATPSAPALTSETVRHPDKAVFRIPGTAYLGIAFLTFCVTPLAFGGVPGLQAVYVFPLVLLVFVWRTRTVATRDQLDIRTVFGKQTIKWSQLKGLSLTKNARVRAVTTDGSEVLLPTVRTRHLPVLSLVSGGKIPDPSGILEGDPSGTLQEGNRKPEATTSNPEIEQTTSAQPTADRPEHQQE
jgi:hypothetical protein